MDFPPSDLELPTAQLRHTLADGSWHIDWLIAVDEAGERPVMTFRLGDRLETLAGGGLMEAVRLVDHRPAYMEYEGEISRGRGSVVRLRRGFVRFSGMRMEGGAEGISGLIEWREGEGMARQSVRLARDGGGVWSVSEDSGRETALNL